jgi:hypothetical protein
MKFRELRDVVEKMSGSKLTGQEISTWYKKNPDVKKAAKDAKIKQAVEIALDHGGAMNYAIKKIEKIKRGLADHPAVAKALSYANFGEEKTLEDVSEGTWQTPKNKGELKKLMDLVSKPVFATKPSDIDKYMKQMPFGDDELYDALESLFYAKDSDGKIARPIKNLKTFPKTDLNQVAMDSLNGRWLTAKKKGNGWDITHIMFDFDEAVKRKSGSLRPGKKMKAIVEAVAKIDPMDKAERMLNYKIKELQYKTALKTFNEYDADPEVKKEGKGTDIFQKYSKVISRLSSKEQDEILDALYTMNTQSGGKTKEAHSKVKELLNLDYTPEGDNIQET